jgi:hypothetical protein
MRRRYFPAQRGGREGQSYDPCKPHIKIPRKVIKGLTAVRPD